MPTGAPTLTTRWTPNGTKIDDGYQTLVTFAADPNVKLWEKSVTPPGIDGEEAVDTTTMHNTVWRTFAPRALRTLTECTFTAAYDPMVYDEIIDLINVRTVISIQFPDDSAMSFHGYLRNFQMNELTEGTQPEATITIQPTNQDSNSDEYGPVFTEDVHPGT